MTRAEQPPGAPDDSLAAESRESAIGALLRFPPLRRLWGAQFTGNIGDMLALLVLLLLTMQAAAVRGASGDAVFGGGYRGMALVVTAVFGLRLLSTLLFGAVLLGPVSALVNRDGSGDEKKVLDRRWTMFGADVLRAAALIVAPLWIDWTASNAFALLLVTVFVAGVAERISTVTRDSAAPALLPGPPPEGAAVRPLPDHNEALRRLWLRTSFGSLPLAAAALVAATLVSNLLGPGADWFSSHQTALASYVAAGLFAAAAAMVYFLELPDDTTPRPRSPLEGLRRPRTASGTDQGRTGAIPLLVGAGAAVAGAIAAAVALAPLRAADLGGGPVTFGLLVVGLSGGTVGGIRLAPRTVPTLSRRRLLALALTATGAALLAAGLVPDTATVLALTLLAGVAAGVAAHTAHALLDQETEDSRRPRTTEHLQAAVRLSLAVGALVAPALAALIGPHRVEQGAFVFDHGGAAFTLMLVGALLLPVAALFLGRADDRQGVPLRRDLRDALGDAFGGGRPVRAPASTGFFIALEGGDGAGKSTQVEAVAEWIRGKGHEVVVTKEPGATPVGKRLRSILLDVSESGLSHRAEALLYAADRAEHIDTVVRPALERGAVVVSDRYIDSSVAYQGAGRDLSPAEIARISRWATDGLVPHLTVLLDVSPQTARERFTEAPDRMESEPAEFHERVRAGFLTLAAADPTRYLVVDAGQEPEAVTAVVRHRLDQVLPLSEAEKQAREEARRRAEEEARRKAEEEAARKAEEERKERERQERLEKLRREEEERKRREAEEERRREEARKAEEARQRAEEEQRRAEEERQRREAEERARQEEQERLRQQKEEEDRLRAEAEERRRERQRKAEEALLKAEQARAEQARAEQARAEQARAEQEARTARTDAAEGPGAGSGSAPGTAEVDPPTQALRKVQADDDRPDRPSAPDGSSADTAQLPQAAAGTDAEETAMLPQVQPISPDEAAQTAMLPQFQEPDEAYAGGRETEVTSTHELPRPSWAQENQLDDAPSLADELLGPREPGTDTDTGADTGAGAEAEPGSAAGPGTGGDEDAQDTGGADTRGSDTGGADTPKKGGRGRSRR
ncbi:dTMP kinase [Streptomyces boncukensis]|uniref:Thymidylate kinase n=1 Tax=Streptomyces boncukensis TaxID=2711219 RepID=A0A6G4WRF4_9ACTN|nr:dTMP kinase [Streptomyces boncukensis]NGO67134.1 dTMP kinase [Streptomyces boncukensis]